MFLPRFPIAGSVFFALLLCFLSLSPLQAQAIVGEEGDSLEATLSDYWDKHFGFRFGATVASGAGVSRKYSFANLTWKHDFDWISFNFEGEAFRREFTYTLVADPYQRNVLEQQKRFERDPAVIRQIDAQIAELDKDFVFTSGEADTFYREASAKLSLSDTLQLSLGYHTIVWGQVSGFSPVDYVLPLRVASGNLSFSKTNNRLPQQAAILYFFPIPQIELQTYYFPKLTLDAPLRAWFENSEAYEMTNIQISNPSNFVEERGLGFEYPQKDEEAQYAARLLFYFDWITFAFVYYDGWGQFTLNERARIESEAGRDDMNNNVTYYRFVEEPRIRRIESFGFESAIPIGRWTLSFDTSQAKIPTSLSRRDIELPGHNQYIYQRGIDTGPFFGSQAAYMIRQTLIDYAINENGSSFEYDEDWKIWSIELSADLDKWVYGFGLLNLQIEASGKGQKFVELRDQLRDIGPDNEFNDGSGALPIINVGRYLSEDKKDIIGMSLGFFGAVGGGLLIYFGQEYYESLQVGLALEILQLTSSNEADGILDGYELKEESIPSLRWLFGYKF